MKFQEELPFILISYILCNMRFKYFTLVELWFNNLLSKFGRANTYFNKSTLLAPITQ